MRNYEEELKNRVEFIKGLISSSGAKGIIYGNSGGKDSALVGILCREACANTVGIIMPCESKCNFGEDMKDGLEIAKRFSIETRTADLTASKKEIIKAVGGAASLNSSALTNIAPRLRMIALYSIAAAEGRLVAGTGNRSEIYMGYFTKWGDGAYDFDPIGDLTVKEIYEFLKFLGAPENIIKKAPSGGLFEGQTDEKEMGISYDKIDDFILNGRASPEDIKIINRYHKRSEHKRKMPLFFKSEG